jgi:hypothetical protein
MELLTPGAPGGTVARPGDSAMPVVVQKFGGSSVTDIGKLKRVAARVAARRRAGDAVCVVVSAMGDTTDELLARFVTPEELRSALQAAGLVPADTTGLVYNPLADEFSLSRDTDVNYFATALSG